MAEAFSDDAGPFDETTHGSAAGARTLAGWAVGAMGLAGLGFGVYYSSLGGTEGAIAVVAVLGATGLFLGTPARGGAGFVALALLAVGVVIGVRGGGAGIVALFSIAVGGLLLRSAARLLGDRAAPG